MPTNNFKIFDENNIGAYSDADYLTAPQRLDGVNPGVAIPGLHNKLYRQATIMPAAIGDMIVGQGFDANDTNKENLTSNLEKAIKSLIDPYSDDGLIFSKEYLAAFHKKLIAKSPVVVDFTGDSTTAGDATSSASFHISNLVESLAKKLGVESAITALNHGHSGGYTSTWASTWVSENIAANPDCLVVRWGINDGYNYTDANSFTAALRSGLATIRASRPLESLSIILMTPNAIWDIPSKRDETWSLLINPIIRQAAKDFHCCFIDTFKIWKDSVNSTGWINDDTYDGNGTICHIHPRDVMNTWIASVIVDVLFPTYYRNTGIINNLPVTPNGTKLFSDGVSLYPLGISIDFGIVSDGWPFNCTVTTIKTGATTAVQLISDYEVNLHEGLVYRTGWGSGDWKPIRSSSSSVTNPLEITRLFADNPSLYPLGVSIDTGTVANGFPFQCTVTTIKQSLGTVMQLISNNNISSGSTNGMVLRTGNGTIWDELHYTPVNSIATKTNAQALSSYALGTSQHFVYSTDGFPISGQLVTFRSVFNGASFQMLFGYDATTSGYYYRTSWDGGGAVITPWVHVSKLASQVDSSATDIAGLKADFNALLAKMRTAGLM